MLRPLGNELAATRVETLRADGGRRWRRPDGSLGWIRRAAGRRLVRAGERLLDEGCCSREIAVQIEMGGDR